MWLFAMKVTLWVLGLLVIGIVGWASQVKLVKEDGSNLYFYNRLTGNRWVVRVEGRNFRAVDNHWLETGQWSTGLERHRAPLTPPLPPPGGTAVLPPHNTLGPIHPAPAPIPPAKKCCCNCKKDAAESQV